MPPRKRRVPAFSKEQSSGFSSSSTSSSSGPGVSRVSVDPGGPRKLSLRFGGCVHEEHKQPVYSISFFEPLPDVSSAEGHDSQPQQPPPSPQFFASVGANRATVYKIDVDGALGVAQAYVDEDDEEIFYAVSWSVSVALTPLLLLGGFRGLIKVIDCQNGEVMTTLVGHGNAVNELRVHPVSPALVLSVSKDESCRLWNVYTSCCVAIFAGDQGHRDEVLSCDVHLLGGVFASCGMDNTVKVWSLEGPHPSRRLARNIEASFDYTTEAPDAAAPVGRLGLWRLDEQGGGGGGRSGGGLGEGGRRRRRPRPKFQTLHEQFPLFSSSQLHSDYVDCVRWAGHLLLSKSTASKVVLWRPDLDALHGHTGVALGTGGMGTGAGAGTGAGPGMGDGGDGGDDGDDDGDEARAAAAATALALASAALPPQAGATTVLREFEFKDAEIWFVRFALDPSLSLLAVGNKYGKLWLWNVDGSPAAALVKGAGHAKLSAAVRQTAFSPDRRYLLCCCEDGSVWKWALDY